jgi:hypothetical protein
MRAYVSVLGIVSMLTGCEWLDDAESAVETSRAVAEDPDDAPRLVEDAIFESLECHDVARPGTLARVRAVLDEPTLEEIAALATAPEDLASIVALGGVKVEATVVVLQNVLRLALDEQLRADLQSGGWDGVSCDEDVVVSCTAGTGRGAVLCEDGAASAIRLDLHACTIDGGVYDGAITVARVVDDDRIARVSFAALTIDEATKVQGAFDVRLDVQDRLLASVRGEQPLKIIEHGGPSSGLSCGEELAIDVAAVDFGEDDATIELSAHQRDADSVLGLATVGEHLTYSGACGCPDPGSGVEVVLPQPLGEEGAEARLQLSWSASQDDTACATAYVSALEWPTTCWGAEAIGGEHVDCGEQATVSVLTRMLQAFCVGD